MFVFVFPGQGSQYVGMGKPLFDAFACARAVFQEVDESLNQNLSRFIFEGSETTLNLTENAQPALMAVSMAVMRVLEEEGHFSLREKVRYVAGHSLGEYSALTAVQALTLRDTARLLRLRGQAMQRAVPVGQGAMAAVLGLDMATLEVICENSSQGQICEIANDNCQGQLVLSGHMEAIERAVAFAKEQGARKSMLLLVSAPFHCSLMQPAAQEMEQALARVIFQAPIIPILTNVSAREQVDETVLKSHLVQQVTGRVRWRETIEALNPEHVSGIVEIGAGTVLTGLAKRIQPDIPRFNLQNPADIEAFLKHV